MQPSLFPVSDTDVSATHRCWVAVASAEHVRRGRHEGFMQVCHGKAAPLRRLRPGDQVVYYSPTVHFGGKDRLQSFTALGVVRAGDPYEVDMGGGFVPWRRDVDWQASAQDAAIAPLLDRLSFTEGRSNWGYAFRFGLLQATADDMALIAMAMRAGGRPAGEPPTGGARLTMPAPPPTTKRPRCADTTMP